MSYMHDVHDLFFFSIKETGFVVDLDTNFQVSSSDETVDIPEG